MAKEKPASGIWPPARWRNLLTQGATLLAERAPQAEWHFGGGSALAVTLDHRVSYDVDLFISDAQIIPYLSPRLADKLPIAYDTYAEFASTLKLPADKSRIMVAGPFEARHLRYRFQMTPRCAPLSAGLL